MGSFETFTREGGTVFEALAYYVPPVPGKVIKPVFPSPPNRKTNRQTKRTTLTMGVQPQRLKFN